jgi:hypothetical protein
MLTKPRIVMIALVLALGCDDPNASSFDPSTAAGRDGAPGQTTTRPERCEALEQSAWALADEIGRAATCNADSDCRLEMLDAHCLSPFVCPIAVSGGGIALERVQRAVELSSEYRREDQDFCGCTIARCAVQRTFCHPTKKRCMREIVSGAPRPQVPGGASDTDASIPLDAALPPTPTTTNSDASTRGDAALGSDAGMNPYACRQASDCTIRNVGNCCGYYPRCVNANAILTPPDCSGGMAGVCGFPTITSCECRDELCVAQQNGNSI